jgi:hypothetical protein
VNDAQIYRWLESKVKKAVPRADVLPCGGRISLLDIYQRRSEFARSKAAFLADTDMWLFTAIPVEFSEVIWTSGYSIENDVYAGANIELLLDASEAAAHERLLISVVRWFAFEVEEFRAGRDAMVDVHVREVVDTGTFDLDAGFCCRRRFCPPTAETIAEVEMDYKLRLRGKNLFQAILYFLNAPRRASKHSGKSVIEVCLKMTLAHPYLDRVVDRLAGRLS